MSKIVDSYMRWSEALGQDILYWARPTGAPISITSVSMHVDILCLLRRFTFAQYCQSNDCLLCSSCQTWPLANFSYAFAIALFYLGFVFVGKVRQTLLNTWRALVSRTNCDFSTNYSR